MVYLKAVRCFFMEEEKLETLPEEEQVQEPASQEPVSEPKQPVEPEKDSIDALLSSNLVEIKKEDPNDRPYDEVIEEARKELLKSYKKSRTISNISMLVAVAILIGAFIMIVQKTAVLVAVGYSLAGATLVAMIVYYIINRNRMPKKVKDYVTLVSGALNGHAYNSQEYKELKTDPNERLGSEEFFSDRVYKDMNNVVSRNIVRGLYGDRGLMVGDVALRSGQGKTLNNLFIGKYISYKNDLHFENRYIIRLKGKEDVDLPNDIEDLAVLEENEKLVIYGPEGHKYKEDLGTKFIPSLKEINVEGALLGLSIVIWAGHSAAYLSYSDEIVALPFEKEFNKEAFEAYTATQLRLLDALKTLLK